MHGGKFKRSFDAAQEPRKMPDRARPPSPMPELRIFLGTVVRCRSTTHDIFSSAAAKNTRIANFARRAERRPPSAVHLGRAAFSVQQGSFLSHRPDAPGQCALSRSLSFPVHPLPCVSLSLCIPHLSSSLPCVLWLRALLPSRNFDDEFPAMRYSSAALARKIPCLLLRNAFRGIPRFRQTKKTASVETSRNKKYTLFHEPRFVSLCIAIAEHSA